MKISLIYISCFLILTSCWPTSVSFVDKGGMPEEWKTFSVINLTSDAPNTPLNYASVLTEQLKDGIQTNTKLLLNPETGKGEIVIYGSIKNYTVLPVAVQEGDNASLNRLTITAQFNIEISKPEPDQMNLTSTRFIDYDSNTDLAVVENQLLEEISKQIVQDVINKLNSNW
jgi:hypothetical protein